MFVLTQSCDSRVACGTGDYRRLVHGFVGAYRRSGVRSCRNFSSVDGCVHRPQVNRSGISFVSGMASFSCSRGIAGTYDWTGYAAFSFVSPRDCHEHYQSESLNFLFGLLASVRRSFSRIVSISNDCPGDIFMIAAVFVFTFISVMAGAIGSRLRSRPAVQIYMNKIAGVIFAALAVKLAFARR
jgi:hypothetical protein